MACELIELGGADECVSSDGGIYRSELVDGEEIQDVTFDADGNITAIVMKNPDKWVGYDYDDDDSAFYNQTGARTNKKVEFTQQSSFKFAGVTTLRNKFANGITNCCKLVAIHRFNSGFNAVQGIEQLADGSWGYTKKKAKATPSVNSNTGADEDTIVVLIDSTGRRLSHGTTLTTAEIDAL